jgi:thiazole synthase
MKMKSFYGVKLKSQMMLGTAQYPSPAILSSCFEKSKASVATVSLRRESSSFKSGNSFWSIIKDLNVKILPNTAGCHTVKEAVTTAHMAREVFDTKWIKLEVVGEEDTLQPDVFGLVEAAKILTEDGFEVFPYTTEDLVVADKLLNSGCKVLMPWGSPIGSGQGLNNIFGLKALRSHFPDIPMVIDAGIGLPSHATKAMELGFDAILLNTAIAKAGDPVIMSEAFSNAIIAGTLGRNADPMEPRDMANPSTPIFGKAFL